MPLGEHIRDDMRSEHAKFYEFSMHKKGYINLSLFSFSEFCRTSNRARATRLCETLKLQNMDEDGCYVQLYFI
jgi:hypothetical protein